MPLRSPKIYSFIFGFQRRVWWPKWTPASSNSFMEISTAKGPPYSTRHRGSAFATMRESRAAKPVCRRLAGRGFARPAPILRAGMDRDRCLALAVLEALARALLAVLLALFHARVARQESIFPQPRPHLGIVQRDGAGKS